MRTEATAATMPARFVSFMEAASGATIVLGHNVWRVVPNEVPILFCLGLASSRLRNGGFAAIGFKRPASWRRTIVIAVAAAGLRIVLGMFVVQPLATRFWPVERASRVLTAAHAPLAALTSLAIIWTFAAFGEEVAYRGYLTRRMADAGGGVPLAWGASTILVSVLFGYGHVYKGPAGIIDSTVAGLVLGGAYLLSGRVLWTTILAHGLVDSFAVAMVYFGWDS